MMLLVGQVLQVSILYTELIFKFKIVLNFTQSRHSKGFEDNN